MLTLAAARELVEEGLRPRIKIDQRKTAGQEGGVHQATGIFWGVKGNKILVKPAKHGGKIEKCKEGDISLWVSESATDEKIMAIHQRQQTELQVEEKRFVIIDVGYGTVYTGPGSQHPFSNSFDDVNIYRQKEGGRRSALINAKAARGHLRNSVERDPDKYRASSLDNLEVIKFEKAEGHLKEIQAKLAVEVKADAERGPSFDEGRISQEVKATEKADAKRKDKISLIDQMFNTKAVDSAEESTTSNACKDAFTKLGQKINALSEAMALALDAREEVQDTQKEFAIALAEMMEKSGQIFNLQKQG